MKHAPVYEAISMHQHYYTCACWRNLNNANYAKKQTLVFPYFHIVLNTCALSNNRGL